MERSDEVAPVQGAALGGPLTAIARAWRLPAAWGAYALGLLVLSMVVSLPTHRFVDELLEGRYAPGSAVHDLGTALRADHADALSQHWAHVASTQGLLALIAFLFGVFAAGGWLGALLDGPDRSQGRRFLAGGVRYFWRFLRLGLIVLVLVGLLRWALFEFPFERLVLEGWFALPTADTAQVGSEGTALWIEWGQAALHFVLFGLVLAWALLTRTRMALQGRRSALLTGLATLWTLIRHPYRTLAPLLSIFLIEALLVTAGLGAAARALDGGLAEDGAAWRVIALAACSLIALTISAVLMGARYAASVESLRALVQPIPRPDPWQHRVGGPGGPQYPIGDQDEFSVSM